MFGLLALALALTLVIVACGGDDATEAPTAAATVAPAPAPTMAPTAAPAATMAPTAAATMAPTAAATMAPTAAPRATAAPTIAPTAMMAREPVQPRLRVSLPPGNEQFTIPYPMSQVSEKLMPIYSHMIGRNIKSNVEEPQLATFWEVESDGKTWHFTLAEGVPFYKFAKPLNDYTFSAKDVFMMLDLQIGEAGDPAFSTKLARSPGRYNSYFGNPEDWIANTDYDITLNLPKVNLDAAFLLSDEWSTGIMSRDHWDDVGGEPGYQVDPVGNGPWSYILSETNGAYLHERVENHWRVTPEFHELEIKQVQEAGTRQAQLFAYEADIIPLVRTQRGTIEGAGFKTYRSTLPSIHQGFGIVHFRDQSFCSDDGSTYSPFSASSSASPPPGQGNHECGPRENVTQEAPIRDARVRHAMNLAINRNEINNVFYQGLGFPLVDYFPPWRDDFKEEWTPFPGPNGETGAAGGWPYPGDGDPAQARALLADAGYPDGFETTLDCLLTHKVVPEWPDICEQVIVYLSQVGITAKLATSDSFGSFRAKTRDPSHNGGNWIWSASPSLDPPCNAITYSMVWELGQAYREWPAASELYFRCANITNLDERREAAQDFAEAWLEGHYSIPLVWVYAEAAVNPGVVQEYEVNMLHMGPVRYHEHTQPVYK